jgi:hypothetical protein
VAGMPTGLGENEKEKLIGAGLPETNGPILVWPRKKIEDYFLNFDSTKRGFKSKSFKLFQTEFELEPN